MLLKGKLAQKSWAIEAVVGAVLLGDDVASGLALTKPRFCFNFASEWPRFSPQSWYW